MKLIRAFGIFVLMSLIIGVGSAFNGNSSTSDESEIQEQSTEVVDVSFFESEEINKTTEEIIEEDVVEEIKDDESEKIINNEENKKEVVNKQNVSSVQSEVKDKVNKQENSDSNSNSSITESKQEEINNNVIEEKENLVEENNIQEETKSNSDEEIKSNDDEETIWEYLGISEYEYYNSPMLSWQKVTHSSFEECQNDGQKKIDNGEYEQYWCYQVNSYSGKMLGVMLKLS